LKFEASTRATVISNQQQGKQYATSDKAIDQQGKKAGGSQEATRDKETGDSRGLAAIRTTLDFLLNDVPKGIIFAGIRSVYSLCGSFTIDCNQSSCQ